MRAPISLPKRGPKRQKLMAGIVRHAADHYLEWAYGGYSCVAIGRVFRAAYNSEKYYVYELEKLNVRVFKGLHELGLDCNSFSQFDEFPKGEKRQRARALWMEWVALMFEEGVV